jgi:biotin carboxylase
MLDRCDGYIVIVEPVAHFFRYVTTARAKRIGVIVLTANEDIVRDEERAYAGAVEHYPEGGIDIVARYDAGSDDSALAALRPYVDQIRGLVAGDELTVALTARLGGRLGFDYAAPDAALAQQIKSAMKRRLVANGVSTPEFAAVATLEAAAEHWHRLGGDAMLKMVDYAMSFGVFRVRTRAELDTAWNAITAGRATLENYRATEEVVVERYVAGRGFSVEGYVSGDRIEILNVCEKLSHANFMVVGHFIPARTSAEEERLLDDVVRRCAVALGIRNTVFHAEVHIADGVAYIIECASRPPGQFSVDVLDRIYGFDMMAISIDLACGVDVDVRRRPPRSWNAIMALYSDRTGIVREIEGLEALRARAECYSLRCAVESGHIVHKLDTFRDVLGLAMLEAEEPEQIEQTYRWAREAVRFRV